MPQLAFSGTQAMMMQKRVILLTELGVKPVTVRKNKNTYVLSFGGSNSVTLLQNET